MLTFRGSARVKMREICQRKAQPMRQGERLGREVRTNREEHYDRSDLELEVLSRSRLIQNSLSVIVVDRLAVFHHAAQPNTRTTESARRSKEETKRNLPSVIHRRIIKQLPLESVQSSRIRFVDLLVDGIAVVESEIKRGVSRGTSRGRK